MPTEIVETIGSGGDYADPIAWDAATRGLDLVSDDEVRWGELIDSTPHTLSLLLWLRNATFGGTSDATHYRGIRPAAGNAWDVASGTGAGMRRTSGSVVRIQEDYFRFGSCGSGRGLMGVFQDSAGDSSFLRCVRVDRRCWIDSIYGKHSQGDNVSNTVFQVSVGMNAGLVQLSNLIAVGTNNKTTSLLGPRFGFGLTPTGGLVQLYNCDARWIRQNEPSPNVYRGAGVVANDFCEIVNVVAMDNGNIGSSDRDFILLAAPVSFSNCVSSDSTATGSNSFTGEIAANTWVGAGGTDFHPHPTAGSKLINTGLDLSSSWYAGSPVDADGIAHDRDGHGWEIGAYNFDTSAAPGALPLDLVGPTPRLERTVLPSALAGELIAPTPQLLRTANPAVAELLVVAPGPKALLTAKPAALPLDLIAPAARLLLEANPDPAILFLVAPDVRVITALAAPRVAFELAITRTEAVDLLISRRVSTSARVTRVLERELALARARYDRLSIKRAHEESLAR